jgi:hypothetical protein
MVTVSVTDIAALDNKTKAYIVVSLFIVYYMYVKSNDNGLSLFFTLVFAATVFIILTIKHEREAIETKNLENFMLKLESDIMHHTTPEMMLETVYSVHEPLKNINHIKANEEVCQILYNLRFLLIYDRENFLDIIVLLEQFFKLHFNLMLYKANPLAHTQILQDLRTEILNMLHSCHYNIPTHSVLVERNSLTNDMQQSILHLMAIMSRYVNIVFKKYRKQLAHKEYKFTRSYDTQKNNRYHLYY